MKKTLKAYRTAQGAWQISFTENHKQRTLYLGKNLTSESATEISKSVTEILECRKQGKKLSAELKRCLAKFPKRILENIEKLGLFEQSENLMGHDFVCHFDTKKI